MLLTGRIVFYRAAALIALGGLYDVFVPKLPANLAAMCGKEEQPRRLVRELLRALGESLFAVGATVALLVNGMGPQKRSRTLIAYSAAGIARRRRTNAFCMYRVGSPFLIPLAFVLLTVLGTLFAWVGSFS